MPGEEYTIFSDLLECMGVKHTEKYSDHKFHTMPFPTLFGLKKLLEEYGVDSVGIQLGDSREIEKIPCPFIAQTLKGLVIVKDLENGEVSYLTQSAPESIALDRFLSVMTGKILVPFVRDSASEPEYAQHRFSDIANRYKKWVLTACVAALIAYLFVFNELYRHLSTIFLTIINMAGIYITYLLVQKSAHIKSRHADAVCSVVEVGGCDDILNTEASKFFGIFGWSEVGFAYFSVSLLCLLVFPQYIGYLALSNAICLPFSFWSVWYQKFRAKTWCTLCLCVQSMLWLLFFCYLGGGWFKNSFPIDIHFFVLGITYIAVMLGLNAIMPLLDRNNQNMNGSNNGKQRKD